jgi:TolB protein
MNRFKRTSGYLVAVSAAIVLVAAYTVPSYVWARGLQQPQSPQPAAPTQQPSEVELVITGDPGTPPRYAVPDLLASTPDAMDAAKTISEVLWADFNFEKEFYLIPRDTYSTVPVARSVEQIPFASWRELGADAVIFGSVAKSGQNLTVQVRLFNVRTRQSVFSKEYSGSNPRLVAHTAADEIHLQQRALRGVARTKLAFSSDRNRESLAGPVKNREVKEIYMSDYDGANQRRITTSRDLNITPVWSPDARAIAYTSYRRIVPDIFISFIYQGMLQNPTKGQGSNFLPVFSPDGTRMAFMSNRDGNPEIYVMNVDGSNVRRVTNHPGGDASPTWSPSGNQLAFTSDRSGSPQIYIASADGTNLRRLTTAESYADRPTWSPAPFNEIAFAARTPGGFDIKVYDLETGQTKQLTFGEGTNESPAFSPNGRHIAFTTTRFGRSEIATMGRDGSNVRQITRDGNNWTPSWSN